jgi:hypothetical protein
MLINEVILLETYVNLFPQDREKREKYKDEVWEILQTSYASMGGIKGNGFGSPEDMVNNIQMWKLVKRNGRIVAVKMYKDKQGRKGVAAGTDGSAEGKTELAKIMQDDVVQNRSYSEYSENVLRFARRNLGDDIVDAALIPAQLAQQIDPSIQLIPGEEHWYHREIGGELKRKIMLGNFGVKFH